MVTQNIVWTEFGWIVLTPAIALQVKPAPIMLVLVLALVPLAIAAMVAIIGQVLTNPPALAENVLVLLPLQFFKPTMKTVGVNAPLALMEQPLLVNLQTALVQARLAVILPPALLVVLQPELAT
jgi:hypothetical protein